MPIRRAHIFGIRQLHLLASCSTRRLLCLRLPSVITASQKVALDFRQLHTSGTLPRPAHGSRQPATMHVAPVASMMQLTCRCALRQARPAPLHNAGGLNRTLRVAHRQQQPQRIAARRQTVCSAQAAEVLLEITCIPPVFGKSLVLSISTISRKQASRCSGHRLTRLCTSVVAADLIACRPCRRGS